MWVESDGSTLRSEPSESLEQGSTLLSPDLNVLLRDPERRRQRQAIEANLFGASEAVIAVGRYRLLQRLGEGGMGTVYAAYDDSLDRKIAIKLIRPDRIETAAVRDRTLREARALARMSHPNVVHVYEVGEIEDQLFLAMEFLAGPTLRHWLDEAPDRDWRETVGVFRQAGEGLAAAHAEGIVHRDFKPHNAMFGVDRRVRVLDFGLARIDRVEDPGGSASPDSKTPLDDALTASGTLLGTPAYMAPEQLEGKHADARSDQFGFCVALYEALYGTRPFVGRTLGELIRAVSNAQIQEPSRGSTVPAWVRRVLLRGLDREPAQRFESMRGLLDALGDDPVHRRRQWWVAAGLVGLIGGGVWGVVQSIEADAQVCSGMDAKLAGIWDDSRRLEVETAMLATSSKLAPATWERVEPQLDAYAQKWVAARTQACEATHRGEQSDALLDLRMACLDERLVHLSALINVLAKPDEKVVSEALQAVEALPSFDRCANVETLQAELPPPEDPEIAARVTTLQEQLAQANALEQTGQYEAGLAATDAVVDEALELGYEPLLANAWLEQGELRRRNADYKGAEASLELAYATALGLRMHERAGWAASILACMVGTNLSRHADGRTWAKHAKPLIRAADDKELEGAYFSKLGCLARNESKWSEAHEHYDHALRIEQELGSGPKPTTLQKLGELSIAEGKYAKAREYLEQALALAEKTRGPEHPEVAKILFSLGTAATDEGKFAEATQYLERAIDIQQRTHGPEHLNLTAPLSSLAAIAQKRGDYAKAREIQLRVLAIKEKHLGPNAEEVAGELINMSLTARDLGNYEQAHEYLERALVTFQAIDPEHHSVAICLLSLGQLALAEKQYEAAQSHQLRALAIWEKQLEPGHPKLAYPLGNLGDVALERGDAKGALEYYQRALKILEGAHGPEHLRVGGRLVDSGQALLELRSPTEALAPLERALKIFSSSEGNPLALAGARFTLARALWDVAPDEGRDRPRAHELASLARAAYAEANYAEGLDEVDAWLREHSR
jgi:tetratricopeptide (TPR) repeat protein/tRNA A-37 threonylcarbamoyl transferase component Bud32